MLVLRGPREEEPWRSEGAKGAYKEALSRVSSLSTLLPLAQQGVIGSRGRGESSNGAGDGRLDLSRARSRRRVLLLLDVVVLCRHFDVV